MPPWLELDRRGALALHRAAATPLALRILVLASRLSGAPPWLAVALLLPWLDPAAGPRAARALLLLGSVNLVLYYALKRGTRRRRPFEQCEGISACSTVPDAFSFPSGHTLHAVSFALLLAGFYPALLVPLGLFAVLVGLSRVMLGLHYPSDVIAGALIGGCTAAIATPFFA